MSVQTEELQVKFSETGADSLEQAYQRLEQRNHSLDQSTRRASTGLHLVSDKKFAHNLQDIVREFASGASAADVLANSVYRVGYSFKGSLPLLLGAGLGFALFDRVKQDVDAADKSLRTLANDLAALGGVRSADQLAREFHRVVEEAESATSASKSFGSRVNRFLDETVNPAVGTSSKHVGQNQDTLIESALKKAGELMNERASAEDRIRTVRATSLQASERQGELDRIELERAIKIAAIERERIDFRLKLFQETTDGKLDPKTRDKLIKQSDDAAARRKQIAGADSELSADVALRKYFEQEAAIIQLTHLANFRGTKEEEIKLTLEAALATAQRHVAAAQTLEQKEEAALELAKTRKSIRENDLALTLKQIALQAALEQSTIRRDAVERSVGLSPEDTQRAQLQAERDAANAALKAASDRVQAEKNANGDASDEAVAAQIEAGNKQRETAAALAKFEKDTAFAREQSLNAAKATTAEMSAQSRGMEFAARQAALTAKYEAAIAQAIFNGRTDLAGQLLIQQKIDQLTLKRQRFLAGGDEGEKNRAGRTRAANDSIDQQINDEEDRRRRGAYTHHPDAYGDSRTGRAHPDAYGGPGRSNKRMSDDDWHDQFTPRSQLRDRAMDKRTASDKQEQPKPETTIVGQIGTLISTLNALPSKIGILQ